LGELFKQDLIKPDALLLSHNKECKSKEGKNRLTWSNSTKKLKVVVVPVAAAAEGKTNLTELSQYKVDSVDELLRLNGRYNAET